MEIKINSSELGAFSGIVLITCGAIITTIIIAFVAMKLYRDKKLALQQSTVTGSSNQGSVSIVDRGWLKTLFFLVILPLLLILATSWSFDIEDLNRWWILIPLGLLALFGLYKLFSKGSVSGIAGGFWNWLKSSIWTILVILLALAIIWWITMRAISWWNSPDPIDVAKASTHKAEIPSEAIARFTGRSLQKGEFMLEKDVPYGFYVYESKTGTEGYFSFFTEFWNCGKMTVLPRQGDFLDVVFTVNGPTNCLEGYSYNIRFKPSGETEWYGRHGKLVPGVYTITANQDFYAKFGLNY